MPRFYTYLIPLFFLILPAESQESALPTAKLAWRNGDTLNGKILPSSGDRLTWKSEAFAGPFRLNPNQLKSIEFPKSYLGNNSTESGQFRITFSNGDRLFGDLIEIGPETVTFKSPRFSENLVVKRSYLDRIERMNNQQLKYSRPGGAG